MSENLQCGIYLFTNMVNGKYYVGSARLLQRREYQHRRDLNRGAHQNPHFQNAWNKYASGAFTYDVLEYCEEEQRLEREDWWMALLGSLNPNKGYNKISADRRVFLPEVGKKAAASRKGRPSSRRGIPLSAEHRKKLSESHKGKPGRPHAQTAKDKISAAQKGVPNRPVSEETKAKHRARKASKETRDKMAEAMRGHQVSPETRAAISQKLSGRSRPAATVKKMSNARTGKPWSEARREAYNRNKAAASLPGFKKRTVSDETRKKISAALVGKKLDPERVAKMAESKRGSRHSDETKRKMSESQKRRWQTDEIQGA